MRHVKSLPRKIMARVSHRFTPPSVLVQAIGVKAGHKILELGNPVGFFASACLRTVGDGGAVYVAGPTTESLEKLTHMHSFSNLHNVLLADVLVGNAIPKHDIDVILLTNLLSNSLKPDQFCLALNQYLKPSGEIILIDWDIRYTSVGPDIDRRVSKEEAVKLVTGCGLKFKRVLKTPGYHYGLVFTPKPK